MPRNIAFPAIHLFLSNVRPSRRLLRGSRLAAHLRSSTPTHTSQCASRVSLTTIEDLPPTARTSVRRREPQFFTIGPQQFSRPKLRVRDGTNCARRNPSSLLCQLADLTGNASGYFHFIDLDRAANRRRARAVVPQERAHHHGELGGSGVPIDRLGFVRAWGRGGESMLSVRRCRFR